MEGAPDWRLVVIGANVHVTDSGIKAMGAACSVEDSVMTIRPEKNERKRPREDGLVVTSDDSRVRIEGNCTEILLNGRRIPIPKERQDVDCGLLYGVFPSSISIMTGNVRFAKSAQEICKLRVSIGGNALVDLGQNTFGHLVCRVGGFAKLRGATAYTCKLITSDSGHIEKIKAIEEIFAHCEGYNDSIDASALSTAKITREGRWARVGILKK